MSVGHGPALTHHPSVQVLAADKTIRHDPAVTVGVGLLAADHLPPPDPVRQRQRRLLAATPGRSARVLAKLAAFRRIDAVQPDAGAVDLDGVAVDHRGHTLQIVAPTVSLEQAGRGQARARVKAVRAEFIGGLAGFIPA